MTQKDKFIKLPIIINAMQIQEEKEGGRNK